jgi:hypothetical protein
MNFTRAQQIAWSAGLSQAFAQLYCEGFTPEQALKILNLEEKAHLRARKEAKRAAKQAAETEALKERIFRKFNEPCIHSNIAFPELDETIIAELHDAQKGFFRKFQEGNCFRASTSVFIQQKLDGVPTRVPTSRIRTLSNFVEFIKVVLNED